MSVTTAFKSSASRTPDPKFPAKVGAAADSGSIVTVRPGQASAKLIDGTQKTATVPGEVSADFA